MTHTAKHTPGPWVIDDYFDVATVNGTVIVRPPLSTLERNRMHPSERKANARLIAAAPAMYEALVETMRVLRSLRDNKEEWYTLVTPELLTAWDKNKAVLAQAEEHQHG